MRKNPETIRKKIPVRKNLPIPRKVKNLLSMTPPQETIMHLVEFYGKRIFQEKFGSGKGENIAR